jgi:hypothetical protein
VPLPAVAGQLSLRVHALESLVVLETPTRSAPDLVRAIRKAPRRVCAALEEGAFEIRLRCRSNRIVARLVPRDRGYLLEVGEARGLPWSGLDGPVLLAFDPASLELGEGCPGSTPAGRAECLLARGDRAAARAALERITDGPMLGLAALRLGDLALERGEHLAAARAWGRVQGQPWQRLAAARLCEASWSCLSGARVEQLYSAEGLPQPLALDLLLHRARSLAFLGRGAEAARSLLAGDSGPSPCASAPALCRRLALNALRSQETDAMDGLLLWLETPERDRGPAAYETERAAAAAADRMGAPLFAASVLAAAAGHVPAHELGEHLLRTCELYLRAGDAVRAGVVLEFARARLGKKGLSAPRWRAVERATASRAVPPSGRARATASAQDEAGLLAAAERSAQAARTKLEGGRP